MLTDMLRSAVLAATVVAVGSMAIPLVAQTADRVSQGHHQMPPTPRAADGHSDLSGVWTGRAGGGGNANDADEGEIAVTFNARGGTPINFERDNTLLRRMDRNVPQYKPEYWERVQYLDQNGSAEDPSYGCQPEGVPRIGPPNRIIQLPTETVFLYNAWGLQFREIPTDGRAHTPEKDLEGTWFGEARGRWDGDTFLIDTIGFTDASWLGIAGWLHGQNMHVVERLHRDGNTLAWEATVDDPDYLLTPWTTNVRAIKLNPDPNAELGETLPCSERDVSHLVSREHH
jgi:hypothetical protein